MSVTMILPLSRMTIIFTEVRGITTPADDLRPVRSDPSLRGGAQPCAAPLFAVDVPLHASEVARG